MFILNLTCWCRNHKRFMNSDLYLSWKRGPTSLSSISLPPSTFLKLWCRNEMKSSWLAKVITLLLSSWVSNSIINSIWVWYLWHREEIFENAHAALAEPRLEVVEHEVGSSLADFADVGDVVSASKFLWSLIMFCKEGLTSWQCQSWWSMRWAHEAGGRRQDHQAHHGARVRRGSLSRNLLCEKVISVSSLTWTRTTCKPPSTAWIRRFPCWASERQGRWASTPWRTAWACWKGPCSSWSWSSGPPHQPNDTHHPWYRYRGELEQQGPVQAHLTVSQSTSTSPTLSNDPLRTCIVPLSSFRQRKCVSLHICVQESARELLQKVCWDEEGTLPIAGEGVLNSLFLVLNSTMLRLNFFPNEDGSQWHGNT